MWYNSRRDENFARAQLTISEKKWYGVDGNAINIKLDGGMLNMGRSAILILVIVNSCSSN